MLSKEKILYQVKLILDYLPDDEYKLIPQETIDYIEENFEYDENFIINPDIPLENQNIDDETFEILDKIVKQAEREKQSNIGKKSNDEVKELVNKSKISNEEFDIKVKNIELSNLVELLKKENEKIPKIKELVVGYKDIIKQKDDEIAGLEENNEVLYEAIQKIPKCIRNVFIGELDIDVLKNKNY